jgi:glycerophosphoryl diester phosphodiesterase
MGAATNAEQPFHIQAHRGAGIARPENTLESFQWAWKIGVTPEADLRTTKDGHIVCFHDADLTRVGRAGGVPNESAIESIELAELQSFDVGEYRGDEYSGQRVPTLNSVFEKMQGKPNRVIYLDLKRSDLDLDKLLELIHQHGVERQVIFTSPKHELIRDWKRRLPESLTLNWNGGTEAELTKKLAALRQANFDGITHLQIHVRVNESTGEFTPSEEFLKSVEEELEKRGIVFQVLPWESADDHVYRRLLELGADSFATDYPEVTLKAVKDFRGKRKHVKSRD